LTASVRATLPALAGPDQRRTVFVLGSTLQELIFILGPPAAGLCAALGGPRLAVGVCAVLVLLGTLGYVRDPNVDAGRRLRTTVKGGSALRSPGVLRLLVAGSLLVCALSGEVIGVVAMVSGTQATSGSGLVLAVHHRKRSRHRPRRSTGVSTAGTRSDPTSLGSSIGPDAIPKVRSAFRKSKVILNCLFLLK
jgi:hypothetical protein